MLPRFRHLFVSGFDPYLANALALFGLVLVYLTRSLRYLWRLLLIVGVVLALILAHASIAWLTGARTWRTELHGHPLTAGGAAYNGELQPISVLLLPGAFAFRFFIARGFRHELW